eukprot:scaffold11440_cov136-Isochrysis_galbana.AAC.1
MDGADNGFWAALDLDCSSGRPETILPNMRCVFLDSTAPMYEAFLGNGEVARSVVVLKAVVRLLQPKDRVRLLLDGSSVTNLTNSPDGALNHTHTTLEVETNGLVASYHATEGDLPTYRLPSAYRWYSVPTKRPEAKQAHAPEIFAIPAEDLREDKRSSQYLPSWDFRLLNGVALGLTLLSCVGSRGRFGDEAIPMSMSFGAEAEGAARASAGVCSMLNQK